MGLKLKAEQKEYIIQIEKLLKHLIPLPFVIKDIEDNYFGQKDNISLYQKHGMSDYNNKENKSRYFTNGRKNKIGMSFEWEYGLRFHISPIFYGDSVIASLYLGPYFLKNGKQSKKIIPLFNSDIEVWLNKIKSVDKLTISILIKQIKFLLSSKKMNIYFSENQ